MVLMVGSGWLAETPVVWLENRRWVMILGIRKVSCSLTTLGMLTESSGTAEMEGQKGRGVT